MITNKVWIEVTKKPIKGVPVGEKLQVSATHARALIAVGLAKSVRTNTSKRPTQRAK